MKLWQEMDGEKEKVEGASTSIHESMIKLLFKTKFKVDKQRQKHNHIRSITKTKDKEENVLADLRR